VVSNAVSCLTRCDAALAAVACALWALARSGVLCREPGEGHRARAGGRGRGQCEGETTCEVGWGVGGGVRSGFLELARSSSASEIVPLSWGVASMTLRRVRLRRWSAGFGGRGRGRAPGKFKGSLGSGWWAGCRNGSIYPVFPPRFHPVLARIAPRFRSACYLSSGCGGRMDSGPGGSGYMSSGMWSNL